MKKKFVGILLGAMFVITGVLSFIPEASFANVEDEGGVKVICTVSSSSNLGKCAANAQGVDSCTPSNTGPACNGTILIEGNQ